MKILLFLLFLTVTNGAIAEPIFKPCKFNSVIDGDTIKLTCGIELARIRLYCIDAPEKKQIPYSINSTNKLKELLSNTKFVINIKNKDWYGRYVGEIIREDGINVNLEMVKSSNAAVYPHYCSDDTYNIAESNIKNNKIGIWDNDNLSLQQTPWIYRTNKRFR